MIEIRSLQKSYGRQTVLERVDLDIDDGRITAVVGPNAAGKTTLIKSILGLVHPDAGSIRIGGRSIDSRGEYRADIGYMPQIARFPDNLTTENLLDMLYSLRPNAVGDASLIEALGLSTQLTKPLRLLSGGTRQKVNAALAFLFEPSILILDEPTSGLDPIAAGAVKARITSARDRGVAVVLTSHVLSEIEEMADDVAFLMEGRIRFAGPIHELKVATRQFTLERAIAQVLRGEAA
jgi:Cu-processing system ATP-binding protein